MDGKKPIREMIMEILDAHGENRYKGLSADEILRQIKRRFGVKPSKKSVMTNLSILKTYGKIYGERIQRTLYRPRVKSNKDE